jgi:hypothetical protein
MNTFFYYIRNPIFKPSDYDEILLWEIWYYEQTEKDVDAQNIRKWS